MKASGLSSEFCIVQVVLGPARGTWLLDEVRGGPHFRGLIVHKHVNTFGTKQSVCNIVDGHLRRGSTVHPIS